MEADVQAVIASEGLKGVTDPFEALAVLATEALAMKDALAARVNSLNSLSYPSAIGTEQIRAAVQLYERAMDRSAKFLDILMKSGIEERRVRISEDVAGQFLQVLTRIHERLELTPYQRDLAKVVVPQVLREQEAAE